MASSPTIQTCLTLTHGSFPCTANIRIHNEMESDNEMSKASLRFSRGHALLRKQVKKAIILQPQKAFKRRFTFPGNQEHKILFKRRRRFASVALPTKFLLGGNINDPLNLRSLEDEKVNQQLNSLTPASSPMPISRSRTKVQVLIPPNIYDPLNLNTGEEIEFNLLTSKHRKRRRHRKSRREDSDCGLDTVQVLPSKADSSESLVVAENSHPLSQADECSDSESVLDVPQNSAEDRVVSDKIVSPVVPQGSPAKFFKRYHSRSFSKDTEEKSPHKPVIKRRRSKTRLQQHADYMKFRANAEKFCYGNHIIKWDDIYSVDQRLHALNKNLFYDKDVMDIGCNSGELTLYIAEHWKPRKIIGIDIDKKLINIAQRKVRTFNSKSVSKNSKFPQSMSTLYGSLAKVGVFNLNSSVLLNNVAFFENSLGGEILVDLYWSATKPHWLLAMNSLPKNAVLYPSRYLANYVPGSEEYLDTQKPEFDVILCLRLTKWIHLNFGDDGLKLAFKRMYAQLRTGGYLILEPQPWFTYSTSKRITPSIYNTYCNLKMRPEMFCEFLLSKEVGFSSCHLIGRIYNYNKVYRQPLYLLTKGFQSTSRRNIQFHSDQWNRSSDEQGTCRSWSDADFLSSYSSLTNPDTKQ